MLPVPCAGVTLEERVGKRPTHHLRRLWWDVAGNCLLAGTLMLELPPDQAIAERGPVATTICGETQMSDVYDVSRDPSLSGFIAVKIRSRVLATRRIPRSAFVRRRRRIKLVLDDDLHQSFEA